MAHFCANPCLTPSPFKWRHFESEIVLLGVRWYLRYSLSYRGLEEMMLERGLHVDHTTIYRWVQRYAPELEKRCRPHLKTTTDSWSVDETYVKVKGVWVYLYRAVDSQGNTLEFLLSPTRDAQAAKRFFASALAAPQIRLISLTLTNARPFSIIYLLHCSQIAYHASILWQQLSSIHYQDSQKKL